MKRIALASPLILLALSTSLAQFGGELRFAIRADPKTFNPALVNEEPGETVRYLTGGVLLRVNRQTQALEPELARSWKVLEGGRRILFDLRPGLQFSDGSPFSAKDVAFTMEALTDPEMHSPTGDPFRTAPGRIRIEVNSPTRVTITFPGPVAGLERLFDQVAILSSRALEPVYRQGKFASAWSLNTSASEMMVLGPFRVAEYKTGSHVLLTRNPHYWKRDGSRRRLPYLDSVRLSIQQNRDLELLRFRRGELHLVNALDSELFDALSRQSLSGALDLGPALETEQLWFNQVTSAPIPARKKEWFRSTPFRRAISEAINRADLCRIVYKGRATPGAGPVSPANQLWVNAKLTPVPFDPERAKKRLLAEGFSLDGGGLRDRGGNPVELSVITNSGNKARERMATMIQQDLARIGVRLNVVTLDFPSLIERITRTYSYEACLLGLNNVDLDPNGQMNVWLSSASNHQWNPSLKKPATPWEAEIDRLMLAQASEPSPARRKAYFDQVQEIVYEQAPFIYLVYKNSLAAISPDLLGAAPAALWPQTYWNVERLSLAHSK